MAEFFMSSTFLLLFRINNKIALYLESTFSVLFSPVVSLRVSNPN